MTSSGVETAVLFLDLAGTIYPVRCCPPPSRALPPGRKTLAAPYSLLRLAARVIVRDVHHTAAALRCAPQALAAELLRAAFLGKHDPTADLIIARWGQPVLRLADIFPDGLFPDLSFASYRVLQLEQLTDALSLTTGCASGFVHYLKRAGEGCGTLKCLDVSGFPTAEVVAIYLFSHCIIAINEHRQDVLWQRMLEIKAARAQLDTCEAAVPSHPQPQPKSFRAGSGYVVRVDLRVDAEDMLEQLLPCFGQSEEAGRPAKLRASVGNLYITGLRDAAVFRILEAVPLLELSGLCLSFTRLGNWPLFQVHHLLMLVRRCTNLVALDLSKCGLNFGGTLFNSLPMDLCSIFRETLEMLPNLLRLNLSVNKVAGCLPQLLPPGLRLSHLALDACRLVASDLRFLASAHFHRERLLHLDLSALRPDSAPDLPPAIEALFAPPWPLLKLLRLAACRLDRAALLALSQALLRHDEAVQKARLQPGRDHVTEETAAQAEACLDDENRNCLLLPGLSFLDLSEGASRLDSFALLQCFGLVFRIRSLRYLKTEYPHDCYFDGTLDFEKKMFFDTQAALIKEQCKSEVTLIFNHSVMPFD